FIPSGISAPVSDEMSTRNCYLPLEPSKRPSSTFCCRLDDEKLDLINNTILPEAVHFWERALMVRETKSTIRLN
ncbi:hypothetical protein HN011_005397, partial [Eciton burchellii]